MDVLIGISVILFGCYWLMIRDHGEAVERKAMIFKDDVIIRQVPMDSEGLIDLESHGVSMVLEIRDGKIRVVSSSCRQQICVRKGWTGQVHDPIVCVPNNIIVDITGNDAEYDAISR